MSWWRHKMGTFSALLSFVRGAHRSPVDSPHKSQWRGASMFSLICAWTDGWASNRDAGDLRCHRAHYDVIVMIVAKISGNCHSGTWKMTSNTLYRFYLWWYSRPAMQENNDIHVMDIMHDVSSRYCFKHCNYIVVITLYTKIRPSNHGCVQLSGLSLTQSDWHPMPSVLVQWLWFNSLGLTLPVCELGRHWLRSWLFVCFAPSHDLVKPKCYIGNKTYIYTLCHPSTLIWNS